MKIGIEKEYFLILCLYNSFNQKSKIFILTPRFLWNY
jgi:hypothetical protein